MEITIVLIFIVMGLVWVFWKYL